MLLGVCEQAHARNTTALMLTNQPEGVRLRLVSVSSVSYLLGSGLNVQIILTNEDVQSPHVRIKVLGNICAAASMGKARLTSQLRK